MPNLATIMKEIKKKPDLLSYFSEIMVTNNKKWNPFNPGSVEATAALLFFPPDGEKLQ